MIKSSEFNIQENRNFLYSIVTGDETWCFQDEPETKRQSSKWQPRKPRKARQEKSKIKLICFYDSKGIIHTEFVPTGQTVNAVFYVAVLKRLVLRIRQIRPEYRKEGRNHSPYSPDMATCDFCLFGKLHLAMKGKRYANVDAIQKASTAILNAVPKDDLKKSCDKLLDRANRCIQCEGDYFEGDQ